MIPDRDRARMPARDPLRLNGIQNLMYPNISLRQRRRHPDRTERIKTSGGTSESYYDPASRFQATSAVRRSGPAAVEASTSFPRGRHMKFDVSALPAQATLFETYAPVEQYLRSLESLVDEPPVPPAPLRAEDAFLLHLVGSMSDHVRAIVNLAGARPGGRRRSCGPRRTGAGGCSSRRRSSGGRTTASGRACCGNSSTS